MTFFWSKPLLPSSYFHVQSFFPDSPWSHFPSTLTLTNPLTHAPSPASLPSILSRHDTPSLPEWETLITHTLHHIHQNSFQKVVLARQTTLTLSSPLDPSTLLNYLLPLQHQTTLFMVQLSPDTAFLGATPEKLFSRHDNILQTEAVAGTRLSTEPWTPKEHSEFNFICTFLTERLSPLSSQLTWSDLQDRPFGHIRHLSQKLTAQLSSSVPTSSLIQTLHPTPALGGFPAEPAINYLRTVEPFCRGWYGSPIGLISDTSADIAVAIRSMLIQGNQLHLFAGAGIVAGSSPLHEWEELDRKISHILRCF